MYAWRENETMSYALRRDQNPGVNLRRMCRRQVENALAIARGETESEDTPVHEIRKRLKKARALLQIASAKLGHGKFKKQDRCFRDVGRLISDVRDAEVRLQTVRQLQEITRRTSHGNFGKIEELLRDDLEQLLLAFAGWQREAIPRLENLRDAICEWPTDEIDSGTIARAVQHSYKLARHQLGCVVEEEIPENFHELRSKAKRLFYQLRILRPINPLVIASLTDDLDSLNEVLGRSHDLHFLSARLQSEDGEDARELLTLTERSEVDLQRRALDMAERFFQERPRDFGHRLLDWLKHWINREAPNLADTLIRHEPMLD